MSETREEAVRALEGLREQHQGARLWTCYEHPELMIPRGNGRRAYIAWEPSGWTITTAYEMHTTLVSDEEVTCATLADCLEWLEAQS